MKTKIQTTGSLFPLLLMLVPFIMGCVTLNEKFVEVDEFANNRQYEEALNILEDPEQQGEIYLETDQVLKSLDIGMLHFYAGNYPRAQEYLSEAERLMEELFTASVTQAIGSFLLNDTVIDYPGEPYEELYVNVFKALSFLAENNLDSAFVEINRLNDKLNLLEDKYGELAEGLNQFEDSEVEVKAGSTEFHNSALGRYLSLLVYRADGNWDGASIDADAFRRAFAAQPAVYDFPEPDIRSLLEETDKVRLNVLAFTGRMPEKRANTLFIKTFTNQVLIVLQKENEDGVLETEDVESLFWPAMSEGYQFTFELPVLHRHGSDVKRIQVVVDGEPQGDLELVESLENVGAEMYKLKEPLIYAKTITRTIIKGLLNKGVKDAASTADPLLGTVLGVFTDVATDASEVADLRAARYYPGFAYGGEFRIDPGSHKIVLEYYDESDSILFSEDYAEKEYQKDNLNLIYSYIPR